MHYSYVEAVGTVALVGLAAIGIAGITTGWVPPFGRSIVLRPKLWGYGALVSAVGMTLFVFLGPFRAPDIGMAPYALGGMGVAFVGMALQMAARRPGRPSARR
ncbi:hypothetical protein [Streptomyces sp. NPDC058086]|uniref:hypothetical protein n=1 Tax=Streptomyces sp. NPDC058086 TaxID=3346334 RepID=UPI0036EC7B3F